jgi:integrase
MSDSIAKAITGKPEKPYPEFPLFAHATKRWAKKIKGRLHYFGPWANWQAALEDYQYKVDYLQQGRTPPPRNIEALTVDDLVNGFLEHREAKVDSGEMARRTFTDYKRTGDSLIKALGRHTSVESLNSHDFAKLREKMAKGISLNSLGNEIQRARVILNFAYKNEMLDRPVKMGLSFSKPSKQSVRKEKLAKPAKIFTVEELRTLYHAAKPQMKCFMLLALNGGLGNGDIGQMEPKHTVKGWIRYPRPKTQIDREFPLWAETSKAIEATRQTKHPELPYLFTTKYGQSWYKDAADSPITKEFSKLLKECGLQTKGRGFYALRHTFRTVADGNRDRVAIDRIMGHADESMGANYREWIEPERLQAVVDHVYKWVKPMFKKPAKKVGA